jgi:hypothetical protein
MAEEDCRDWRIIESLMQRLENVADDECPCTVFIPKKRLQFPAYPAIALYWNEGNNEEEGFEYDNTALDIILVYTDGKDDDNEAESYVYRYRNVGAHIRKQIMVDTSLGGLCEYVHVVSSQPAIFIDNDVTYLKITRVCNQYDPFL